MKNELDNSDLPIVEKLASNLASYAKLEMEYQRVNAFEKIASASAFWVSVIIIAMMLMFCLMFVVIAMAVVISHYTSWVIGFGGMAAVFLFIAILGLIFRKRLIERPLYEVAAGAILDSMESLKEDDE